MQPKNSTLGNIVNAAGSGPAHIDHSFVIPSKTQKVRRRVASVDPKLAAKREEILNKAFNSSYGLTKLAQAMQEPVKMYLDMKPVARQLVVTDQLGQGEIAYFDLDIHQFPAVSVGINGATHKVYLRAQRVILDAIQIGVVAKIPMSETVWRKYDLLARALQRIRTGLGIKEDLLFLQALDAAHNLMNTPVTTAGSLTLSTFASAFEQIETWPLNVYALVMNPHAIADMRSWNNTNVDEVARIQLRETGYLGGIWGANMWVTRLVPVSGGNSYVYAVAPPEYLGYMPFWADSKVLASNNLDDFMVGFVGWELLGLSVWNARAVVRVQFAV